MRDIVLHPTEYRCHELTGVLFGSERMPTVTHQVAEGLTVLAVAPSHEESERRIASVATGRFRRPVMVLDLDGAYGPTRPDSAREPSRGQDARGPNGRGGRGSGETPRACASIGLMARVSSMG